MIELTKLDGDSFSINVFHIFKIKEHHETRIYFVNGQSQIVKESKDEVKEKIAAYYRQIFKGELPFKD